MNRVTSDPKVSCPIVCGEEMRATGLFFALNTETFLVTARHNVLPTQVTATNPDGSTQPLYSTEWTLPQIDVYLRTPDEFECYRYDVRTAQVSQTPEIDLIGIRVDIDPEDYGYRVWTTDDLIDGLPASEGLSVFGFDGESFPHQDTDYDVDVYCGKIGMPRMLMLTNPLPNLEVSDLGLELIALDEAYEGSYRGLSGSPVLGDKLAGIHIADVGTQALEHDYEGIRRTVYLRSAIIPKLLESS